MPRKKRVDEGHVGFEVEMPETLDIEFPSFLEAFNAATAAKSATKPQAVGKPAPAAAGK